MWLFALFLAVPLIEIALFVTVGGWLTLWPTLAIVVATAVIGTAVVRQQGLRALDDLRGAMAGLGDPTAPLAHGAMILLAGALLITPGFLTDSMGLALLVPGLRRVLIARLRARVRVAGFGTPGPHPGPYDPAAGETIDGDFREIDTEQRAPRPPSGWTRH